jgi:hypothetical protein
MDVKDWLPIVFERSNAAETLWNMQIVVILGLIAFLAGAGKAVAHKPMKLLLIVGFLVMVAFNLCALVDVTRQRHALFEFLTTTPDFASSSNVLKLLKPIYVPPEWQVKLLHLTMDAIVVLFIWCYPAGRLLELVVGKVAAIFGLKRLAHRTAHHRE